MAIFLLLAVLTAAIAIVAFYLSPTPEAKALSRIAKAKERAIRARIHEKVVAIAHTLGSPRPYEVHDEFPSTIDVGSDADVYHEDGLVIMSVHLRTDGDSGRLAEVLFRSSPEKEFERVFFAGSDGVRTEIIEYKSGDWEEKVHAMSTVAEHKRIERFEQERREAEEQRRRGLEREKRNFGIS